MSRAKKIDFSAYSRMRSTALKKAKNTTNRILYQSVNRSQALLVPREPGFSQMMDDTLPEELSLAFERHEKTQDRIVASECYGSHAKSLAVIQQSIDKFSAPFDAPI